MGRQEKLIARFEKIPVDFSWDELCRMMKGFGFETISGSGSRYKFVHPESKQVVSLHQPHPGNIVKRYALRQVRECLKEGGLIK